MSRRINLVSAAVMFACGLVLLCSTSTTAARAAVAAVAANDDNACAAERAALASADQRLADANRAVADAQWALANAQAQYTQQAWGGNVVDGGGGWNAGASGAAQDAQRVADQAISAATDAANGLTGTQQAAADTLTRYQQLKAQVADTQAHADTVYQGQVELYRSGPQVQGAIKDVTVAQAQVDDEIAQVRGLLEFDEDYQAAQAIAQSSDATLRDLRRRGDHDLVALGAANRLLDRATRDMKVIEQARIDNDPYVEQARQTLTDATQLRDRLLAEADKLASADPAVRAARQALDHQRTALAAVESDARAARTAVAVADNTYRRAVLVADHAQAVAVEARQNADQQQGGDWIGSGGGGGGIGNDWWVANNNLAVAQQARAQAQSDRDNAAAAVADCRGGRNRGTQPPTTQPTDGTHANGAVGAGLGSPAARSPVPWPPRSGPTTGPFNPRAPRPTPRPGPIPRGDEVTATPDESPDAAASWSPLAPHDASPSAPAQQPQQQQQRSEPGHNTFRPPMVPRDGSARAPAGSVQPVRPPRDAASGDRQPAPSPSPQEKPQQSQSQQQRQQPEQKAQQQQSPQQQQPTQQQQPPQQQQPAQQQQQQQNQQPASQDSKHSR